MMCTKPKNIINKRTNKKQDVPCGKCINCSYSKSNEWTRRLLDEATQHEKMCLVVLTYDRAHVRVGMKTKEGNNLFTLWHRDVQLYLKKLRKKVKSLYDKELRYYVAGEYGDKLQRPHYHLVLFGLNKDDRNLIDHTWEHGKVLWDKKNRPLDEKGFAYACGYINKKIHEGSYDLYYTKKGIIAPYQRMSKGLGKVVAMRDKEKFIKNGFKYEGTNQRVPRAYIKWWKGNEPESIARIKGHLWMAKKEEIEKKIESLKQIHTTKQITYLDKEWILKKEAELKKPRQSKYNIKEEWRRENDIEKLYVYKKLREWKIKRISGEILYQIIGEMETGGTKDLKAIERIEALKKEAQRKEFLKNYRLGIAIGV